MQSLRFYVTCARCMFFTDTNHGDTNMTQYISITEDATEEVVKTIDLTGSNYKRACKVMNGVEMSMNHYDFTATLHGYEKEEKSDTN